MNEEPFEVFIPSLPPTNQKQLIDFMSQYGRVCAAIIWSEVPVSSCVHRSVLRGVLRFWCAESASAAIRDAIRHRVFFLDAPLTILPANRSRLAHVPWCLPPVLSEF